MWSYETTIVLPKCVPYTSCVLKCSIFLECFGYSSLAMVRYDKNNSWLLWGKKNKKEDTMHNCLFLIFCPHFNALSVVDWIATVLRSNMWRCKGHYKRMKGCVQLTWRVERAALHLLLDKPSSDSCLICPGCSVLTGRYLPSCNN